MDRRGSVFFRGGLILLLLLAFGLTGCTDKPRVVAGLAPDFELTTVEGRTLRLSDYKGQVVVLDFWATWCPPCRQQIPNLNELQKELRPLGVEFIGMTLDSPESDEVEKFLEKTPVCYPMAYCDRPTRAAYGVSAVPHMFVIDKEGKVWREFFGNDGKMKKELKGCIKRLLALDEEGK